MLLIEIRKAVTLACGGSQINIGDDHVLTYRHWLSKEEAVLIFTLIGVEICDKLQCIANPFYYFT